MSPGDKPAITFDSANYQTQSEDLEMALYRMIQELLTNSIRHGRSQNINISLACKDQQLELKILDDGLGFDIHTNKTEGIGLKNIHTRCEMMKGHFDYNSTPGKGSSFYIYLPL
jgi:signal transduction histidine kinase